MFIESWQAGFLSWFLTYLLHSTVLLGCVWIVTSIISSRFDALKETLWKFALIGGLVTASMQVGFHVQPITGQVNLFETMSYMPAPEGALTETNEIGLLRNAGQPDDLTGLKVTDAPIANDQGASQYSSLYASLVSWCRHLFGQELGQMRGYFARGIAAGMPALPWLVMGMITLAVASILIALLRLRKGLYGRKIIVSGRVCELFDELCDRAGVSKEIILSRSSRIASPVAMGVFKQEICLPARALQELSDPELEVMLAHELAHLVRRDPLWALICHVMATLLCIQPLNIIASRRLRELAEYECDAWAAAHCDGALPLARCLTQVASWLMQSRRMTTLHLVSGMSVHQSTLRKRVGRLLEEDWPLPSGSTRSMIVLALTFVLGLMIILTPAVSAVSDQPAADLMTGVDIPDPEPREVLVLSPAPEPRLAIEPRFFEVSDPFSALEAELDLLEKEVEGLRSTLKGAPKETEIFNLINQFEQKIASIRDRQARLEKALNEHRPNNPDSVRRSRSTNPEPTHARRSP